MMAVPALFVRKINHYAALGCDCYDAERDALTWQGGAPGVFHPPCRGWGQLAHFAKPRDGELFLGIWSMERVRLNGGVVEHPYASKLFAAAGCVGFGIRDRWGGVCIPVMQSWWGHRAPKKSILYIVGPVPQLPYEPAPAPGSFVPVENMGRPERERTTAPFASFLVETARACA